MLFRHEILERQKDTEFVPFGYTSFVSPSIKCLGSCQPLLIRPVSGSAWKSFANLSSLHHQINNAYSHLISCAAFTLLPFYFNRYTTRPSLTLALQIWSSRPLTVSVWQYVLPSQQCELWLFMESMQLRGLIDGFSASTFCRTTVVIAIASSTTRLSGHLGTDVKSRNTNHLLRIPLQSKLESSLLGND